MVLGHMYTLKLKLKLVLNLSSCRELVFQVFGSVGSWLVLSVYLTTPSPTEFQRKPKANLPYNLDPNQTPFTDYFSGKLAGKKNPKISDLVTGGDYFLQAEMRKEEVVIPVLASLVGLFLLIAVALFWIIKSRRKLAQNSRLVPVEVKRRRFSHPQIVKMTHDFRRVIGRGGFGTVFHGHLDDAPVAVKMYCNRNRNVHPGFQTEVNYLSRVHHKNLINVVGYCNESTKLALVFEYMANGDLKKNLTGNVSSNLTWERRLGIAIDMAKALDYLHDGCEPPAADHSQRFQRFKHSVK
ncbi:probable LRR receptor-like serine/threonine-protein kinase At1g51880 [Momordica charantia]|uniref:Probable LRR receptor-like serine/threonine-protein kinase At1g51880 n=1 Tax=Momordica charantia TaxID=3673 RepID=A0A6J1D326_MOMCH|nr:probable LRR receptor-like serine/threonine-protein kinase At1g51880 [Momordica charantia]